MSCSPTPWRRATVLARAPALVLVQLLAACGEREATPQVAGAAAGAPPAPLTDDWIGQWNGPEGSFVRITGSQGHYELTIQNLDGARSFAGRAVRDTIEFERDGRQEVLRASDGKGTGMKWLADKQHCLRVRAGEGYCRD